MNMRIAGIVLAAGGSTRMGQPKQLMVFEGKSLLRRAIDTAREAGLGPVVVVIGARAAEMRGAEGLDLPGVEVIENPEWERGMGTSLRAGMNAITQHHPKIDAAVLTVCDQVLVKSGRLRELIAVHERTGKQLVASSYGGTVGVPALIGRRYFPELESIGDGEGAKKVLLRHSTDLEQVHIPEAIVDLDRPEDFARLSDPSGA